MSDILYGQSQTEVDRLAFENRNFNIASVLNAIWNHIGQASSRLSNQRFAEEITSKHERSKTPPPYERRSTFNAKLEDRGRPLNVQSPYSSPRGRNASLPRSNSPSYRGETGSPNRSRRLYKCAFCCTNDHSSLDCTKFTSERYLMMVKQQGLCFKCLLPGHTAFVCPYQTYCQDPDCCKTPTPLHAPMLCKAIRAFNQGG